MSTGDLGLKHGVRSRRRRVQWTLQDLTARRPTSAAARAIFAAGAVLADVITIALAAIGVGLAYHTFYYHVSGMFQTFAGLGLSVAVLFVVLTASSHDYAVSAFLIFGNIWRRTIVVWNTTFLTTLIVFFVTKETAEFSRGSMLLFYVVGLASVLAERALVVRLVKTNARIGRIAALRVVLVGGEAELGAFIDDYEPWTAGLDVVASAVLRSDATLKDDLALAAASVRVLRPDDIFILVPWSRTATIEACIEAFHRIPASIHLGPQRVLDRFGEARVSRIGRIASLHLARRPLTIFDRLVKRSFDIVVGTLLLVALSPLFAVIALAIKLDSPGPVLFLQRRYGFNQETFRIVKFRSMTVAEDGSAVRGATRDDPRVTRVGRILRRSNIDELPQLLNVLLGQMSLIGPRPHALVHNQQYEHTVADYARRHNVKPGMTGWAQIHGLRGEISSADKMQTRVEYDLYYIDNWSIGLDLRILAVTLFSTRAFQNAV